MKTANDIICMKPHGFNIIDAGAKVDDALNQLNTINRSFLVVMENGEYKGIFCERDYLHNVAWRGWDPQVVTVKDVMSTNLPMVSPGESVEHVMRIMNTHHARYVPVFDGHHFEGVITLHGILRLLLKDKAEAFDDEFMALDQWGSIP